jgi:hypothetical protein
MRYPRLDLQESSAKCSVVPVQAGTQSSALEGNWAPAFAGATVQTVLRFIANQDPRFKR